MGIQPRGKKWNYKTALVPVWCNSRLTTCKDDKGTGPVYPSCTLLTPVDLIHIYNPLNWCAIELFLHPEVNPTNTIHWSNAHRRRWANIEPALVQRIVCCEWTLMIAKPQHTRTCWPKVYLMLGQRWRRWICCVCWDAAGQVDQLHRQHRRR